MTARRDRAAIRSRAHPARPGHQRAREVRRAALAEDFLLLLNEHRQTDLLPRAEESDEAHRARMESGLVRLERVIELFEEEADTSISRAWAHYWCAQFYRRLDRLPGAEQQLDAVIQLSPDFYQSPFFDGMRWRRIER